MKLSGGTRYGHKRFVKLLWAWVFVLVGTWPMGLWGQETASEGFEKRYVEVYINIIATDVNEALRIADSLVAVASNDEQRAKSLMLRANINHSLGDLPSAITSVLEVQDIAHRNKRLDWQSRSSGFLASTFRSVGLLEESKKYLDQAEYANEKQKESPGYLLTKVNILQERAFHAMEDSLFDVALDRLREGEKYIDQDVGTDARSLLIKATNDQLKAICYLHLGELEKADSLSRSSLQKLHGEETNLRPYIYRIQAESSLLKGQYDSAYHYLQLAEPYIGSSQREELKLLLYGTYVRYYQAIGNHIQAVHYNELYQEVGRNKGRQARQVSNELVRKLSQEKQQYATNVRYGWIVFFCIMVLMTAVLSYVFIKRNHERKTYLRLIADMEKEGSLLIDDAGQVVGLRKPESDESVDKEMAISADTEARLVQELEELEETAFFLDKDVSLTSLSTRLNTNQRYISFIIRKYRNQDFNSYIQHHRINYIINRIKLEPDLLDYKLSYLADLAGFSSHSKFSAVFKSVTGIPPSVFIHYTKEELRKPLG